MGEITTSNSEEIKEITKERRLINMKEIKKYCYSCGSLLTPSRRGGRYNTETGEEYIRFDYKCPNKKWWNIVHETYESYDF